MSSCNAKNILIILIVGAIGFITSPWGMNVLYDLFPPATHSSMVRQMLPYSFIIFPFSLLFSMIAILMLILFIRSTLFHCKNEVPEGSIIAEKLLAINEHESTQNVVNGIRFPEDYSSVEGIIYVVCGVLLLWFYQLGDSFWNHIAPLFGVVFLAAGLTVLLLNLLSAIIRRDSHKYIMLGVLGIFISFIPFFIQTPFWIYHYALIPAGLLCFFIASFRLMQSIRKMS